MIFRSACCTAALLSGMGSAFADSTLLNLPPAAPLNGAEMLYGVQVGTDSKISAAQIQAYIRANTPISTLPGVAPSATTDTTNAANISSGTLPSGRISTVPADTMTFLPTGASSSVPLNTALSQYDYPVLRGAHCSGDGHDDTVPIRQSIATGKTVVLTGPGLCHITDCLTLTSGQDMSGISKVNSGLDIGTDYNMAAQCVVKFPATNAGPPYARNGASLRNLRMHFAQPDTTTRSALTTYPTAIYAQNAAGMRIESVQVDGATNLIDGKGDIGSSYINNLGASFFGIGIDIDGTLDSVRIDNSHFWPYALTPNQSTIMADNTTIGIKSGRMDDLMLNNDLFIYLRKALYFYTTASITTPYNNNGGGTTFGHGNNLAFDTNGGLNMNSGTFIAANVYFSLNDVNSLAINQSGGNLVLSDLWVLNADTVTTPLISETNANGASSLVISGGHFDINASQRSAISATNVTSTYSPPVLQVSDVNFSKPANTTYTAPIIGLVGSVRGSVHDNTITSLGTGTGTFIYADTDDPVVIHDNVGQNWSYSFVASPTKGSYHDNK